MALPARTTMFHQAYIHDLKAWQSSDVFLVLWDCILPSLPLQPAGGEYCCWQPDDIPISAPGGTKLVKKRRRADHYDHIR